MKLAKASPAEVQRLTDWLLAQEAAGVNVPAWRRIVGGFETMLQHCADPVSDVLEFKPELLAAMEDAALLNRWEKEQWLVGRTGDGQWQAAGQQAATIGRAFVGKSVRDVLRQIRDLT